MRCAVGPTRGLARGCYLRSKRDGVARRKVASALPVAQDEQGVTADGVEAV